MMVERRGATTWQPPHTGRTRIVQLQCKQGGREGAGERGGRTRRATRGAGVPGSACASALALSTARATARRAPRRHPPGPGGWAGTGHAAVSPVPLALQPSRLAPEGVLPQQSSAPHRCFSHAFSCVPRACPAACPRPTRLSDSHQPGPRRRRFAGPSLQSRPGGRPDDAAGHDGDLCLLQRGAVDAAALHPQRPEPHAAAADQGDLA